VEAAVIDKGAGPIETQGEHTGFPSVAIGAAKQVVSAVMAGGGEIYRIMRMASERHDAYVGELRFCHISP
jgi:hypothetical protein